MPLPVRAPAIRSANGRRLAASRSVGTTIETAVPLLVNVDRRASHRLPARRDGYRGDRRRAGAPGCRRSGRGLHTGAHHRLRLRPGRRAAASAGRGAQRRGRDDYAAVPLQRIRPRRRLGGDSKRTALASSLSSRPRWRASTISASSRWGFRTRAAHTRKARRLAGGTGLRRPGAS